MGRRGVQKEGWEAATALRPGTHEKKRAAARVLRRKISRASRVGGRPAIFELFVRN